MLPKKARETLNFQMGHELVILGDENLATAGLALVSKREFIKTTEELLNRL